MDERRFVVPDEVWTRLAPLLPGKTSNSGVTAKDSRLFLEAVLWRGRTGFLGAIFLHASATGIACFGDSADGSRGTFSRELLRKSEDSRISNARWSSARLFRLSGRRAVQKGDSRSSLGRSRGGLTAKIVALVDALGNLADFVLLPGQARDMQGVEPLIDGASSDALLAGKAFDADWLLAEIDTRDARTVIPPKANRNFKRDYDKHTYKWRHLIENFFAKIKEFRGIATCH